MIGIFKFEQASMQSFTILISRTQSRFRRMADDNVASSQSSKDVKSHALPPRGVGRKRGEGARVLLTRSSRVNFTKKGAN